MEPYTIEDDSPSRSEGHEVGAIQGMESVVATVSGYHGTERFKLIKLIAQTGASYVGALSRSTTHLVCWKFEGKKYDLARQLGTHIVGHRWLEDCLKEGRRLLEGPYTVQSGQEAGPITWELPVDLDNTGTKKSILSRKRNVLSDQSNASDFSKVVDNEASCFDAAYMNWSDAHLLSETSLPDSNNKRNCSKNVGKSKKVLKEDNKSSNKGHLSLPVFGLGNWHKESSVYSSGCSSRRKRNFCEASSSGVPVEPARRSRRLAKKNASNYPSNNVRPDCKREHWLTESCDPPKSSNSISFDLDNFMHRLASTEGRTSDNRSPVREENRTQALQEDEDFEDLNNFLVSLNSNSSRSCALSAFETSENEHSEHLQKKIETCDVETTQTEQKGVDEPGESDNLHARTELSCVICWTEFCSTRGVLPCGHRFCYSCIQGWADCMTSRGKIATCPLCKTSFSHIIKVDEAASYDQKIYSQTIPCGSSSRDIFIVPSSSHHSLDTWPSESVCIECQNHEPADLLVCCHICHNQWVHSFCLDPPLVPWTCVRCMDLRALYQHLH